MACSWRETFNSCLFLPPFSSQRKVGRWLSSSLAKDLSANKQHDRRPSLSSPNRDLCKALLCSPGTHTWQGCAWALFSLSTTLQESYESRREKPLPATPAQEFHDPAEFPCMHSSTVTAGLTLSLEGEKKEPASLFAHAPAWDLQGASGLARNSWGGG